MTAVDPGERLTLDELIRRTVDRMPPLTPEQRSDLATLLTAEASADDPQSTVRT